MTATLLRLLATGLALSALAGCSAAGPATIGPASSVLPGTPPARGLYDAVLCVTVGATAASCGPATVDIGGAGQALLRVSDIAYRLEVYADQLGITLFHGSMQIDGFFGPYQWSGHQLTFSDVEKNTRYELKVGARRFDAP